MNKIVSIPNSQTPSTFSDKQIQILKNSICKGVSEDEFAVFLMACTKTKLDPFMRQIYAVKRRSRLSNGSWGESMTIQTGIDGYRLIAERTGQYSPGPEPTYIYDEKGNILSATAYIKKQTADGTWHEVSASAYFDEYCPKDKEGRPTGMWRNMPRTMLCKCAESQALRKAFPSEMSGIYTKEEMSQADFDKEDYSSHAEKKHSINKAEDVQSAPSFITPDQVHDLKMHLEECDKEFIKNLEDYLIDSHQISNYADIKPSLYAKIMGRVKERVREIYDEQFQSFDAVKGE